MTLDQAPTPAPDPTDAARAPFPWPPPADAGVLDALVETWRRSALDPAAFFRSMPLATSLAPPLVYFLIIVTLAAGAELFWGSVFDVSGDWLRLLTREDTAPPTAGERLAGFLLTPLLAIVLVFCVAAVLHVMLVILTPSRRGFGATVRVLCYASSPQILAAIPFVGAIAGGIWAIALTVIGMREAHATTTGRATAAVLIPLIAIPVALGILVAIALVVLGIGLRTLGS